MALVIHFLLGFVFSFLGSLTPSMLNMTALKTSIEKEEKEVKKYALGVSLVVIAQVYLAVLLTKHLAENLTVIEALEKVGVFIFILLSYYFYSSSTKGKAKEPKTKRENPFLIGVTLSFLNMFAIPFFCGTVVTLDLFNLFNFDAFSVLFFVLGTSLGTFYILFLYGKYAKQIQKKAGKLIKDINLFLSFLTGLVALFMLLKLFFN
ncbi:MAG: Uncharacterised protein [Polaribacter sejongensis]|nr:MAG: Uncharacterised protein [Polaribacter sejongensis]